MPEDRRLAAIMFTDIVGYTALMGSDEDKAFKVLRKNREIQRPIIKKYHGKWLKEMGDGILASFTTASDAVRCAGEIQNEAKKAGIPLRIGIHSGEVVFVGHDVLGDGVNVASRLEDLAEEGCICISDAVYQNVKNKAGIRVEFIGEKSLKNVDEPIKLYNVLTDKTEIKETKVVSPQRSLKPSIAVLPFVNMSNDPEQEYFCDGMSEEIINALSHIENLRVIARTSAFMFKGKHEDMREIGEKLDVETLLEGSVRKAGNRIRITAQLIKVSDGSHLWSERYDRDLEDIFDIQDEISMTIVDKLKVKLIGQEKDYIVKHHTENLEAYIFYLEGQNSVFKLTPQGFNIAIELFNKSLKEDPNFALAYIGLSLIPYFSSFWGNVPPVEAFPIVKKYVGRALALDSTLAEAHMIYGNTSAYYDWDFEKAELELKEALKLNPNSASSHSSYSGLLLWLGLYDDAINEAKIAQSLDPLSLWYNTQLGQTYFHAGQYEKQIKQQQRTIALNYDYFLSHLHLGLAYRGKQMINEAISEYKIAADLSGGTPLAVSLLASAYYEIDKKKQSKKLILSLEERVKKEYVPPVYFVLYHSICGNYDQAYECLEDAIAGKDGLLHWYLSIPIDTYQFPDKPRFNNLLKNAGLLKLRKRDK